MACKKSILFQIFFSGDIFILQIIQWFFEQQILVIMKNIDFWSNNMKILFYFYSFHPYVKQQFIFKFRDLKQNTFLNIFVNIERIVFYL